MLVTKSGVLPNRLNHRPTAQNRASTKFALNVVARASVIGLGMVALADVIRVTVRANFGREEIMACLRDGDYCFAAVCCVDCPHYEDPARQDKGRPTPPVQIRASNGVEDEN